MTNRQEKFAADLKTKLDDNERVVSSKENEISSTRAELALLEQQIAQYKASTAEKMANLRAEVESASQHCQDLVDKAESELKAVRVMHAELTREDGDVVSACVYVYYMYLIISFRILNLMYHLPQSLDDVSRGWTRMSWMSIMLNSIKKSIIISPSSSSHGGG